MQRWGVQPPPRVGRSIVAGDEIRGDVLRVRMTINAGEGHTMTVNVLGVRAAVGYSGMRRQQGPRDAPGFAVEEHHQQMVEPLQEEAAHR